MVLWTTYTLLVGALVAVAALTLEHCARNLRLPQRWLWVGALAATIILAGTSQRRFTATPATTAITADLSATSATPAFQQPATLRAVLADAGTVLRAVLDAPVNAVAQLTEATAHDAGIVLSAVWVGASVALLAAFILTLLRYRTARRSWPEAVVAGVNVRVAGDVGPAVIGVIRPEIVVPSWLLHASDDERSLVVAHERAHLHSRDHLLLAFGCVALVLLPWHPVVWWMTRRLRLAVELDCDARVLRAGARPLHYGSLLVEMAAHRTALPFGAAALAASPTHLERRLLAMTNPAPRRRLARNTASACLACALLFAACETELPTGAELDQMDVAAIEEATARIPLTAADPVYVIDGVESDAAAAQALAPAAIATVNVMKGRAAGDGGRPVIQIVTLAAAERAATTRARSDASVEERTVTLRPLMKSDDAATPAPLGNEFDGILMIDGQRADPSQLSRLSPEKIERIEVLKGAAAARLFADPAAQNGVIEVYTKAGNNKR